MDFLQKIAELEEQINILQDEKQLQRTPEWFAQRLGKFTGSRIKDLMNCNRATTKKDWSDGTKIAGFGDTAIRYIFGKAMERKYGYAVQTPTTAAMRYGTENEEVIKEIYQQKFEREIKEVGFVQIQDYLGTSADGLIDEKIAVEIKASTNWSTYMSRTQKEFNEKHEDFWQVQNHMLCLDVEECEYIVGLPPQNIYQPEIRDINIKRIYKDEVVCDAILQRAKLANRIIEDFLAHDTLPFFDVVGKYVKL